MPENDARRNTTTAGVLRFPLDFESLFALKKGGFILSGTVDLSSGVATIEDRRIQPSSVAIVSYTAPDGTLGAALTAACAAGTVTITSVKSDLTTETSDASTVAYLIVL